MIKILQIQLLKRCYARAGSLLAKVSEAISWYEPEVLQLSDDQIWQHFEQEPKLEIYRHYIQQMVV